MSTDMQKLKSEVRNAQIANHSRFSEVDTYFGYAVEYFIGRKSLGFIVSSTPDRKKMMWEGRKVEVATEDIKVNKHTIPAGTEYWTMAFPLTGRRDK